MNGVVGRGGGRGGRGGGNPPVADGSTIAQPNPLDGVITVPNTPESDSNSANHLQRASDRLGTPGPNPSSVLGAAGGSEELF